MKGSIFYGKVTEGIDTRVRKQPAFHKYNRHHEQLCRYFFAVAVAAGNSSEV